MQSPFPHLAAAFLLSAALPSWAGEPVSFRTLDGREFKNVTVIRVMGRKIEVQTPSGPQTLRGSELPQSILERFVDPNLLHPPKIDDTLDFTTLDGRHIQGRLRGIAPDGISMEMSSGVQKLPYANLPKELANTFDYDAEDAAREVAQRRQRQRAEAIRQAAEEKAAAQRAGAQRSKAASPAPKERRAPPLGAQGAERLGTPRLGGSGTGK